MSGATGKITDATYEEALIPEERAKRKIPVRRRICMLLFGIPALILATTAASFAAIISLMGLSVIFTERGLVPMGVCLMSAYSSAIPSVILGIMSRKLGFVCGLNKVPLALSIASVAAGTVTFLTLSAIFFING